MITSATTNHGQCRKRRPQVSSKRAIIEFIETDTDTASADKDQCMFVGGADTLRWNRLCNSALHVHGSGSSIWSVANTETHQGLLVGPYHSNDIFG